MLERLKIVNYAIIDNIEIEFEDGFNVFTGESGAGKSIIVDALGFCLGDRANTSIIRSGKDKTIVEAVFFIKSERIKEKLKQLDIDLEDDRLIIRREYDINGKNKITINGFQQTLEKVSNISDILVDFHGQHDHQSLLKSKTHIDYLDAFGKFSKELSELSKIYKNVIEVKEKIKNLETLISQKKQKEDFLKFVVEELRNANLQENEEEELEEKSKFIENYEKIYNILTESLSLLSENEISVSSLLSRSITILRNGSKLNPSFETLTQQLEETSNNISNVIHELKNILGKINFQPEEIEMINSRLDLIRTLKRKYSKNSVKDLINYLKEVEEELKNLEFGDEELTRLREEYNSLITKLKTLSIDLSRKRISKALELDKKVEEKLRQLAMEKAIFKTDIKYYEDKEGLIEIDNKKVEVNEKGIDRVQFLISVNPGENLKPLKDVASGGEISRIMLAIKSVLSDVSEVDMMVFDEIDTGIGGNTANTVGEIIKSLSQKQQIIVITHLPQVASKANSHYKIEKIFEKGNTYILVKKLSVNERIEEIARMIGNISETGLKYAEEMLKK